MVESFGTRLRRARERRGISLADIAARTKVRASLFEAIERDNASHWPSGIFRRAFIRGYADSVGLDADAVVQEFVQLFPDPSAEPPPPSGADSRPVLGTPTQPLPSPSVAPPDGESHQALRLTLVDTGLPFRSGRLLSDVRQRWAAAAWDLGALVAVAVSIFMVLDTFWIPFGVTALCYYMGGILVLGNSPGVCLFAPRASATSASGPARARDQRTRHAEPPLRTAQPSSRTHRMRIGRQRRVGN